MDRFNQSSIKFSVLRNQTHGLPSRSFLIAPLLFLVLFAVGGCSDQPDRANRSVAADVPEVLHVQAGEDIQAVLDHAAKVGCPKVVIHEGIYRPDSKRQALIWFNAAHEGLLVCGEGDVILRADNPDLASPEDVGYPAIVNHVVFFGDGVSNATVLQGVTVTGAKGFQTTVGTDEMQPDIGMEQLARDEFFFSDGGGIKIFGRSYPTVLDVVVDSNDAQPCGGGVSVEHRGFRDKKAVFRNCVFSNNTCRITGAAVDVLPASAADFENCLFVGNLSNNGIDDISAEGRVHNAKHGSGALTVFHNSRVNVSRCTFTGNRNGVDDKGRGNTYSQCLFWQNNATGGTSPGERYEMDIVHAVNVNDCRIGGVIDDLRGSIDPTTNQLGIADPLLNASFIPTAEGFQNIGYRPTQSTAAAKE